MSVHLLGMFFRTFLNAAHTLCLASDAMSNTLGLLVLPAHRARSMLFTVNVLYKLLTYLLTFRSEITARLYSVKICNMCTCLQVVVELVVQ